MDSASLVAGDVIELRVYSILLTGGTARVTYAAQYSGAQPADDVIKVSVPISTELNETNALRFSIKYVAGTNGRNADWKVLKYV